MKHIKALTGIHRIGWIELKLSKSLTVMADQYTSTTEKSCAKKLKKLAKKEAEKKRREEQKKQKQLLSFRNTSNTLDIELLQQGNYFRMNGLRQVYPYDFTYMSYAKGRWLKRKLVDVFIEEFNLRRRSEVDEAIASGKITVNEKQISCDYIIQDNDLIKNQVHRHELPVRAEKIQVVAETDQILVVNKPASIPVHPCGRYRFNSIVYILAKEQGYTNLRGVHRLDRLTSGVLIFGKSEGSARQMITDINQHKTYKEYISRVDGTFPSEEVVVEQPLLKLNHILGLMKVSPEGKTAKTTFSRLAICDDNTSLVKCVPHTGRTHQIRVHLQWLGFPISNDPLYNGSVWGPEKGQGGNFGKSDEQLVKDILELHNPDLMEGQGPDLMEGQGPDLMEGQGHSSPCVRGHAEDSLEPNCIPAKKPRLNLGDVQNDETAVEESDHEESKCSAESTYAMSDLPPFDSSKYVRRHDCVECSKRLVNRSAESLVMYLHALKYKGPSWEFATDLPWWAASEKFQINVNQTQEVKTMLTDEQDSTETPKSY